MGTINIEFITTNIVLYIDLALFGVSLMKHKSTGHYLTNYPN
jgi:hypothetical protein